MMTALAERGRPALDGTVAGNSGSSAFHNSLVIFFRAMPPITLTGHHAMTGFCWRR